MEVNGHTVGKGDKLLIEVEVTDVDTDYNRVSIESPLADTAGNPERLSYFARVVEVIKKPVPEPPVGSWVTLARSDGNFSPANVWERQSYGEGRSAWRTYSSSQVWSWAQLLAEAKLTGRELRLVVTEKIEA